jgi:hypothetical protein
MKGNDALDRQFLRIGAWHARAKRAAVCAQANEVGEQSSRFAGEQLCLEGDGWRGRHANADLPWA